MLDSSDRLRPDLKCSIGRLATYPGQEFRSRGGGGEQLPAVYQMTTRHCVFWCSFCGPGRFLDSSKVPTETNVEGHKLAIQLTLHVTIPENNNM